MKKIIILNLLFLPLSLYSMQPPKNIMDQLKKLNQNLNELNIGLKKPLKPAGDPVAIKKLEDAFFKGLNDMIQFFEKKIRENKKSTKEEYEKFVLKLAPLEDKIKKLANEDQLKQFDEKVMLLQTKIESMGKRIKEINAKP